MAAEEQSEADDEISAASVVHERLNSDAQVEEEDEVFEETVEFLDG